MIAKADLNRETADPGQMSKDLLMQWLEKKAFLSEKDKSTLFEIGCEYLNDVGILYNINQ